MTTSVNSWIDPVIVISSVFVFPVLSVRIFQLGALAQKKEASISCDQEITGHPT